MCKKNFYVFEYCNVQLQKLTNLRQHRLILFLREAIPLERSAATDGVATSEGRRVNRKDQQQRQIILIPYRVQKLHIL